MLHLIGGRIERTRARDSRPVNIESRYAEAQIDGLRVELGGEGEREYVAVVHTLGAVDDRAAHNGDLAGILMHGGVGGDDNRGHIEIKLYFCAVTAVKKHITAACTEIFGELRFDRKIAAPRGYSDSELHGCAADANGHSAVGRIVRYLRDMHRPAVHINIGIALHKLMDIDRVAVIRIYILSDTLDKAGDIRRAAGAVEHLDALRYGQADFLAAPIFYIPL